MEIDLDRLIEQKIEDLSFGPVWQDSRDHLFDAWAKSSTENEEEQTLLLACAHVASVVIANSPSSSSALLSEELVASMEMWRQGILVNVEQGPARNALRRWWRRLCEALAWAPKHLQVLCAHALAFAADLTACPNLAGQQ